MNDLSLALHEPVGLQQCRVAGGTAVALDTVGLAPAGGSDPAAGFFTIDAAGQTISFRRPTLQPGRYFLRIRVSGVECPPSWWVDVP